MTFANAIAADAGRALAKTVTVVVAVMVAVMALTAYACYNRGIADGGQTALAKIKATCEDEAAPTVIDGTQYMCVTKPQWNKVLEFVFQQGVRSGYKARQVL